MIYYRIAGRVRPGTAWHWRTTRLDSLPALWTHLRCYCWPDQTELRVFLASSPERLNHLLEQANAGQVSCSVAAEKIVPGRPLPPLDAEVLDEAREPVGHVWTTEGTPAGNDSATAMDPLDLRRLEIELGAGGDTIHRAAALVAAGARLDTLAEHSSPGEFPVAPVRSCLLCGSRNDHSMKLRHLGGWALLASTLIGVFLSVEMLVSGANTPAPITIVQLVGFLLFIAGLPAIQAVQPQTGRLGQLGLVLLGLGAGIAFVVVAVYLAGGSTSSLLPFASALTAVVGSIVVGWVTIRVGVFPVWIGWLLLVTGVLTFATGYLPSGTVATAVNFVVGLASAVPVAGYGWVIVQRSRPSYAQEAAARA
jgi:hypothetical protein